MMKHSLFALVCLGLIVCFGACQPQPEYCTVKGTVKGVRNGTKLSLLDDYDHFKVIGTARVKGGAFEFHPRISAPTHVYMYSSEQLKDFFLEPGTIVVEVDATDEHDMGLGAVGTPANDLFRSIMLLYRAGEDEAAASRWEEIVDAGGNDILDLYYASDASKSAVRSLEVLDRLAPEIAERPFVAELREELVRRAKTEPASEGTESANYYIDMEYPDVDGNLVSLGSVVSNPANRLVLLDFWATWCSPCREAIPALKELYAKYHDKGLEIYSVSEDQSKASWKSFIADNGMTWVNVLDTAAGRKNSKAWFDYALHGIPTAILLDGETGAILVRGKLQEIESVIASLI